MATISEYAIIRVVPEAFRGEQINVGIVVFNADGIDVRLHASPRLFGALGLDASSLDWLPRFLIRHDDADLSAKDRHRKLSMFPGYVLSELGWFEFESAQEYEARLARIQNDYVARPKKLQAKKRSTSLVRNIKIIFKEYDVMGRVPQDLHNHKVLSNVAVGPAGKLHVDFLLKNGAFHATETADFRTAHESGLAELKEAALASVTLQFAREQLGSNSTKCYFVYSAPAIIEHLINPALQLAERSANEIFNFESIEDRNRYFDIMLAAAGSPKLLS